MEVGRGRKKKTYAKFGDWVLLWGQTLQIHILGVLKYSFYIKTLSNSDMFILSP